MLVEQQINLLKRHFKVHTDDALAKRLETTRNAIAQWRYKRKVPYRVLFEYEDIFKVSYKLTKNIRLYNSGEFYKLKQVSSVYDVTFYKAKIGLEYIF